MSASCQLCHYLASTVINRVSSGTILLQQIALWVDTLMPVLMSQAQCCHIQAHASCLIGL